MFIHAAGVEFNQWKMTSHDGTCLKVQLFLDFIIDFTISELIEKMQTSSMSSRMSLRALKLTCFSTLPAYPYPKSYLLIIFSGI